MAPFRTFALQALVLRRQSKCGLVQVSISVPCSIPTDFLSRFPHRSEGRRIKPGQKIHASVAFIKNYKPKAILTSKDKGWHDILGKGSKSELAWTEDLRDILEMDLFDLSKTPALVEAAISDRTSFGILRFLATTRTPYESLARLD